MERLASPSPAPGGGAASAAVSVVAASLVSMVAGLTIGKKGYEGAHETMKQVLEKSRKLTADLRSLMEEDEAAFNRLFAAWKMPKSTDEEKKRRREAMDIATRGAIQVPWKIAGLAAKNGVTGWIRNLDDGSVEAHMEGDQEKVQITIQMCCTELFPARVEKYLSHEDAVEDLRDFSVIR